MKDTTIAVGLAKNVFEIAISREAGKVVRAVVLAPASIRPYEVRWEQDDIVSQPSQRPCPEVSRDAGFEKHGGSALFRKKRHQLGSTHTELLGHLTRTRRLALLMMRKRMVRMVFSRWVQVRFREMPFVSANPMLLRFCGLRRLPSRPTIVNWLKQFTGERLKGHHRHTAGALDDELPRAASQPTPEPVGRSRSPTECLFLCTPFLPGGLAQRGANIVKTVPVHQTSSGSAL